MSTMNFNTTNSTFRQLMGNGLYYRVPPFQRDYSWTNDEWDDLWQDINGLSEDGDESSLYMGYLVLQSSDNKQFSIIDGQQRMTTISVMILAVLEHLQQLVNAKLDADNNTMRRDQLRSSYIGYLDPVSLVPRSKLELNRHNNQFYQTYLVPLEKIPQRGLNSSEHQLRKAFHWFRDRIKDHVGMTADSGKKMVAFLDQLVDKLFFTVITVTDELNAFKVFETLNARGVRLSATDLLKNYLFSVISAQEQHEAELQALEDRWERIVGLLGSQHFPIFLRVFWNSQNTLVRKSDLFKTIKNRISTRKDAFTLLRNLDQSAAVYSALQDAQDPTWNKEEKQAIEQLLMFSVRQPRAMLMACHARFFEEDRKTFSRILKAIAVVSFRYNVICNFPPNEQEQIYNDIAKMVSSGNHNSVSDIFSNLRAVYPKDKEFTVAFSMKELKTNDNRNKKIVRYILFKIDQQISDQHFDSESATYTLEHILPEHPSKAWSHIEEAKQHQLIYRIGNMTPLEDRLNREVGNKDYSLKRTVYQKSDFRMTRAVAEHYDTWDEKKIDSRQEKLAKIASGIWKIQFDE